MTDQKILSPQLITDSEMLYLCFEAEDKDALQALVPDGYRLKDPGIVFLNQYWVTSPDQLSNGQHPNGWGPYNLTYLGIELADNDLWDGTPCRFWTHYYSSSENMRQYASDRGIPSDRGVSAGAGRTQLDIQDDGMTAISYLNDKPAIISTVTYSADLSPTISGQLLYLTKKDGNFEHGRYSFVGNVQENFEVQSIEFVDPDCPYYGLRPKDPLNIDFGFYTPNLSFVYPGGQHLATDEPF